jgi:hypothetical protein
MRFPRTSALLAVCLSLIPFGSALAVAPEILYGTTAGPSVGSLYTIDPSTGAATLVAPLLDAASNPYTVTGLAFDPVNSLLYGSTATASPTGFSELVTVDPSTGLVTPIGLFNTGVVSTRPETMGDLTFDSTTATLYGAGTLTGNLYRINLLTGTATSVGPSGIAGPRGVGLAATGGGVIVGTPDGATGDFVTYSSVDGSTMMIATLSGGPFGSGSINALAVNASGTLFGIDVDQSTGARPTDLVTIDTNTGVITFVGSTIATLDALAFVPFSAVPEASTWVIAALAAAYVFFLRFRRKKTS